MQGLAILSLLLVLAIGTWLAATFDRAGRALVAGGGLRLSPTAPLRELAAALARQTVVTEKPDLLNWRLAPVAYLVLAGLGLSVVPLAEGVVAAEFEAGVVLWGACESLVVVVVFLHGWSANSPFALMGAYRYVAIGLPVMLISMFVLIAAALPAESLSVTAIVESQRTVWNLVRQPIGLPLFLLLGLSLTLRGPFDYADSEDLLGGTRSEASGAQLAAWQIARLATLVSVSVMASAVFLGGHLGPVLPGFLWLLLKSVAVLAVLVAAGHLLARMPPSRMLSFVWTVLLPLSFLDLVLVGAELLIWG